jgi:hypothetical protein
VAIAGANELTYTAAGADAGSTLTVIVKATNSSGSASAETPPTASVTAPPVNTTPPGITGTATVGQQLSASTGTWSGYPTPAYRYQWERCEGTSSCAAISGATNPDYTAQPGDAGSTLTIVVTASNSSGSSAADSPPTSAVLAAPAGGGLGGGGGGGTGGDTEPIPTTAQIKSAILGALAPSGKTGRIASVVKHRGYQVTFDAPARGEVAISWYELPKGARLVSTKPILIASGRATITTRGKTKLTLKLTARGKNLLKHNHKLRLTGRGTFTPTTGTATTATKTFMLQ